MRPPERQQSLGLLLFLADRLNPARLGVRALLTLACAAGFCLLMNASVRDRCLDASLRLFAFCFALVRMIYPISLSRYDERKNKSIAIARQ